MQFITTTHVGVVDEDLRNTAAPVATSRHGITTRLIAVNADFRVGSTLSIQQCFGTNAERTGAPGVDLNLGHNKKAPLQRLYAANALIASELIKAESLLDLTDFKRDLSELTDRLGHAQDCL